MAIVLERKKLEHIGSHLVMLKSMILNFVQMYTLPFINRFFKDLVIVRCKPKLLVAKLLREYNLF
jgi:hypothetical protein